MKRTWKMVGLGVLAAAAGLVGLSACEVATPVRGPGLDARAGVTLPEAGENVVVVVTHAVLDASKRGPFDEYTRKVAESLPRNPGFIAYSLRTRLLGAEVWTMTMWVSDDAADSFTVSPTHRAAIREGMAAVKSAQFLRFEWPRSSRPPSWSEIKRRLASAPTIDYGAAATRR